MNATTFIILLPEATRQAIYSDLIQLNLTDEDIDNSMNSRLCDLSDTIDIIKYF